MKFSHHILFVALLLVSYSGISQNSSIEADNPIQDFGTLENINNIKTQFVLKNITDKKVYILRADAVYGMKVRINNKTLEPGDTSTLYLDIEPKREGKFQNEVLLMISSDAEPFILTIKGNILKLNRDDRTACFNFGAPNEKGEEEFKPLVFPDFSKLKAIKDSIKASVQERPFPTIKKLTNEVLDSAIVIPVESSDSLDDQFYKANSITFLIDVSASMRDTMRLPLLKNAMRTFIQQLRHIDNVNLIAYSDSARTLIQGLKGDEKAEFIGVINSLKPKGVTMGAQAILFSGDVAIEEYIEDGNNEIFLITDGRFKFTDTDLQQWQEKIGSKKIVLSAISVGESEYALNHLSEMARKSNGSFIALHSQEDAQRLILDEIKSRSRK